MLVKIFPLLQSLLKSQKDIKKKNRLQDNSYKFLRNAEIKTRLQNCEKIELEN